MDIIFSRAAQEWMREQYGKGFIVNHAAGRDGYICFDAYEQSGRRYLRKYLPLPDWLQTAETVEVDKSTGEEFEIK